MKRKLVVLLALALLTGCAEGAQTSVETEEIAAITTSEHTAAPEAAPAEDFECYFESGNIARIRRYKGDDEIVIIPERIGDYTVTSVAKNAFAGTAVKELTYPSTVTEVYGLQNAAELTTIDLSSETVNFNAGAFIGCDKLSCINAGGDFKTVDGVLYTADGKTLVCCPPAKSGSFAVPEGVERIGRYAFCDAAIEEVILPSTLVEICEYAFYRCTSMPSVTLNEGLQIIGSNAFTNTRITEIYLPKSVKECGSTIIGWGGGERKVSASEYTDGLSHLLMYETEFRDESVLTKALRIADNRTDWFHNPTSKVFIDVNGDGFPEMLEYYNDRYAELYYYYTELSDWYSIAEIGSEYFYYYGYEMEDFYYCEPYWIYVTDKELFSEEAVAEAFEKAMALVEELPDPSMQFEVVVSEFSVSPNDGNVTDIWRGQKITEYPYISAHYPESWSIKVNGADILHGGEVEGVSFKEDTLTLDNVEFDSLNISGMENVFTKIELIGDSVLTAENGYIDFSGGKLEICGNGTLTAYGIRGVETEYTSSRLELSGDIQLDLLKPPTDSSYMDSAVRNVTQVSVSGNAVLHCEVLDTDDISIEDSGMLECMHCEAFNAICLYDDARLYAEGDMEYSEWYTVSARLGIKMGGNARMEVKNGLVAAVLCSWGDITLSDNAVMDISVTDGWADCGILLDRSLLEIRIKDSAQLNVSGFITCIEAPRIDISGGTLSCTSCEGGRAIDLQYSQSPYADFEPGFFIGGEVTSSSASTEVFDEDFSLMSEYEKTAIEHAQSISISVQGKEQEN